MNFNEVSELSAKSKGITLLATATLPMVVKESAFLLLPMGGL